MFFFDFFFSSADTSSIYIAVMPHVEQSVVCKRSNSEIIADYASTIVYEGGPNPVWICDEMCLYDMNFAFAFCFFLCL